MIHGGESQKYLLLISTATDDVAFASSVATSAGLTFLHRSEVGEGIAELAARSGVAAIFFDASNQERILWFQRDLVRYEEISRRTLEPNFLHYLSSDPVDSFPLLSKSPYFGHLIQRQRNQDSAPIARQYARIVKAAISNDLIRLTSFLDPNPHIQQVRLHNSGDRIPLITNIRNSALAEGFPSRVAAKIALAVDEVVMNGIFDAPIDKTGKPLLGKVPRKSEFPLVGPAVLDVDFGFDQFQMVIMVTDHFGSLHKSRLLGHMASQFVEGSTILRDDYEGAGLGLASLGRTGCSLYFRCEAGIRTNVVIAFPRVATVRNLRRSFRFLSTTFIESN